MHTKPILFSAPMVRAILDGRKTQTRRVIRPQPEHVEWFERQKGWCARVSPQQYEMVKAFAAPGDILWVRERFRIEQGSPCYFTACPCGLEGKHGEKGWKPSIHMPRWACRVWLEVIDVRVERVREISGVDIQAEGLPVAFDVPGAFDALDRFADLWDSLNAKRGYSWASNPWVWRIEFRRCEKPEGF